MYHTDMTHTIFYTPYTKNYSIVNLLCRIFKNKFLSLSVITCFSLISNLNSNQYLVDMKIIKT